MGEVIRFPTPGLAGFAGPGLYYFIVALVDESPQIICRRVEQELVAIPPSQKSTARSVIQVDLWFTLIERVQGTKKLKCLGGGNLLVTDELVRISGSSLYGPPNHPIVLGTLGIHLPGYRFEIGTSDELL